MVAPEFDVIGPYKIVRILGQGGMGTVYHGVHAKSNDSVAIKVIAPNMAQHSRFRRRFDAEIQTLLRLKHQHIVQLIGFGEEKGLLFYSMEYVDGENLQQQLRREKKIRWDRVLDLAIQVCSALKHAHDFGIIHRDLKPANIMLTPAGDVKLTDFGIAKLFGASDATVAGSILGTADFMAPEQAEGKSVSVRSDLYALGALCYAAIAGRTPFTGKNIPEILFNVRYGKLTPLREIAVDTPKEFCSLIEDLLNREASMRPPTALVVNNRLQSLKVGLTRRDTQTSEGDVEHARELTSIDMSDHPSIASISSRNNDPTRLDDAGISLAPEPPKKKTQTGVEKGATQQSKASVAGPDDQTRVAISHASMELPDNPSGIDAIGKTNFTEVTDRDRKRSSLVIAEENHEPSPWAQWIGVGGLIGVLIICIVVAIWMSRPQSANQLYARINSAVITGDDDMLLAIEDVADRFCDLYPNDARVDDVKIIKQEIDGVRSIRQLQRKARSAGVDRLDAVEQAYLECYQAAGVDSALAKRKLQAMLTVFSETERLSKRQKHLVDAARKLSEKLSEDKEANIRNPALEALEEQMRWAESRMDADRREAWLNGIIELYQNKIWAKGLIEHAKASLQKN